MDNLDESKIEDDDMVEIVFQLTTNFADAPNVSAATTLRTAQSPPVTNVYPTRIGDAVGQKRHFPDSDRTEIATQHSNTATIIKTTISTQAHVQRSTHTKTVTLQENIMSHSGNDRPNRPRKKKTRSKSDLGLFKMFKTQGSQVTADVRSSGDGAEKPDAPVTESDSKSETVNPKKCFVHYDSRSILADFNPSSISLNSNNFQNLKSGAATAQHSECEDVDLGSLLLDTPNFINEIFEESRIRLSPSGSTLKNCPKSRVVVFEGIGSSANHLQNGSTNRDKLLAGISMSDFTVDRRFLSFEHMDHGANYYRRYFADFDHVNYFGVAEPHGPIAISMRREKTDIGADRGEPAYQYRIIIRSAQLPTLRGSIIEDFLPSNRGNGKVHFRDILECLAPELKQDNLKLAETKVAVVDELIKLDEMPLNTKYKIGLVYCAPGQKTEEEMYNNNESSPAFDEFMESIGERVTLKGFDAFRAGLDNRSDTTGTHSLYTRYNHCQLMFHVSTLLPYTENDRQQVVRKRHIGNDIVTVIFQEPGAVPFTPAYFRSHYQHVFVVVRVDKPNTPECTYQIAVTRSEEVPEFGPPVHEQCMKKGSAFRHFLLTKLINAENASLKAKKLALMARRTREQLLNSYSETHCTSTTLIPNQGKRGHQNKLGRSWSLRRKMRYAQRLVPELVSRGALKWYVTLVDGPTEKPCILAVSPAQIVIIEKKSKNTVYLLPCKAVLGWTSTADSLKLYYDTGEVIIMRRDTSSPDEDTTNDIDDIVKRLTCVSEGCETQEVTVIKNQAGKLGFHIQFQGIVGDVKENGPAWAAGLRPSSRLLEVRSTLVAHLEHDQLITQLKGRDSIVVVALPPFPDGQARRSISQLQSPTEARAKAVSVSVVKRSASITESQSSENNDTIAPLISRNISEESNSSSRPGSRESNRAMTRGSMIALNLLEKDLGIEDQQQMDIDQLLESIVGIDQIRELEEEVKELEARSSSSSRPTTPSQWTSQHSLQSDENEQPVRHQSFVLSPKSSRRTALKPQHSATKAEATSVKPVNIATRRSDLAGKRYALGSDNLNSVDTKIRKSTAAGKRFALGSDTLEFAVRPNRVSRNVMGAEKQNGRNEESNEKPDINEIFKIIDKTRLESESNNRSPTDDISEIDAVVSMIEKVLENTDTYLHDIQTRGLPSDSDTDNILDTTSRTMTPPTCSSPYTSYIHQKRASDTPPIRTVTPSSSPAFLRHHPRDKVINIQRKMADYDEDMTRAIEQLDSIHIDGTALPPRRTSISSSSLSEEGSCQPVPTETSDSVNINSESEPSTSDEELFPQRHYTMRRMRREGLLMEPPSDTSDQSRTSDDIPPSPLQMLMERAREAQLDQSAESDNSWVRTTLLRIAELEAALERSNFELQILRKQNREMEQTLEIVDEENSKIRREMDRTSTQLSTFTTWVQNRQLL